MNILIINGPNLNMLGYRDPDQYGSATYKEICRGLEVNFPDYKFEFFQSNSEGELVTRIQEAVDQVWDGMICNFGGYTHTSVAIRDALELLKVPKIEVHLSNIHSRESFRHTTLTGAVCDGIIAGMGAVSYKLAVLALIESAL